MVLAAGYRFLPVPRDCRSQAEGEAATFLQAGHGRLGRIRIVPARAQYSPSTSPDKEAGGPQRHGLARNRNRVQREANIAPAASPVGARCSFNSSRDCGAAGHGCFSIRYDRFLHYPGKSAFLAGSIVPGSINENLRLHPHRDQSPRGQVRNRGWSLERRTTRRSGIAVRSRVCVRFAGIPVARARPRVPFRSIVLERQFALIRLLDALIGRQIARPRTSHRKSKNQKDYWGDSEPQAGKSQARKNPAGMDHARKNPDARRKGRKLLGGMSRDRKLPPSSKPPGFPHHRQWSRRRFTRGRGNPSTRHVLTKSTTWG